MASTKIVFYIYYLLIISPGIHVCVLHGFCKITSRKLFKKYFLGRSHMGTLGTKTSQWRQQKNNKNSLQTYPTYACCEITSSDYILQ
jgi:hypothetical protein